VCRGNPTVGSNPTLSANVTPLYSVVYDDSAGLVGYREWVFPLSLGLRSSSINNLQQLESFRVQRATAWSSR